MWNFKARVSSNTYKYIQEYRCSISMVEDIEKPFSLTINREEPDNKIWISIDDDQGRLKGMLQEVSRHLDNTVYVIENVNFNRSNDDFGDFVAMFLGYITMELNNGDLLHTNK